MSRRAFASWLRSGALSVPSTRVASAARQAQRPSPTSQWRRFASNTTQRQRLILLTAGAGFLTTAVLLGLNPFPRLTLLSQNTVEQRPESTTAICHPPRNAASLKSNSMTAPRSAPGSIHRQQIDSVLAILEGYKIGEVDAADLSLLFSRGGVDDPFAQDPPRDPRLRTLTERPRNAETPAEGLGTFVTPLELFYVRNHMWVPVVGEDDADAHAVTIETPDGEERVYTLRELQTRFATHKVTATLQLGGGAISTAEWEGVLLRDVLADATCNEMNIANMPSSVKHVHLVGLEAYAASIPIAKALDPLGDVLLAFRMNGEPLPRDHGYPLRAVVPGNVAARSVKWLRRIALSDEESPSQWQRRDYKAFCPGEGPEPDWDSAPATQEMPVTSAITAAGVESPGGATGREGRVKAEGYAYSGGGREVVRVDVSTDGGRTWKAAELIADKGVGKKAWCWKRWRYEGPVADEGKVEEDGVRLVVKATDEAYNTQPESHESIYNVRGNLATAWHRVHVAADETQSSWRRGRATYPHLGRR
ncbi:Putative oxidoreductase, molybdopterin-binding domain, eukaryotic molybdopterin oxidoreductase [Colletotrichum destructivum]|uniref:Oxidoreductase, molybdopterin-binding domain, eukaryotic molybdopterin oxidoreductase n=1 Tax=Colletotrichum destructivum TaxID=34406 RepID=A0AAX4I2R3_9PEZI|nr:Putative oxidoreductase, molybdopterin-binding domain, eukaryotic molybdopterin oxidoreductase [Colletotrichum destructivum]